MPVCNVKATTRLLPDGEHDIVCNTIAADRQYVAGWFCPDVISKIQMVCNHCYHNDRNVNDCTSDDDDNADAIRDDADNANHNGFHCEMVLTPTKITSIDKRI